jgi:hypothetical protein
MVTVAVMHEEMHQGASQQEQIREHAEHMRSMLGEQKEPDHDKKTTQNEPKRRSPPRRFDLFAHSADLSQAPLFIRPSVDERIDPNQSAKLGRPHASNDQCS